MTQRRLTIGTKVRINCPNLDGGILHNKIGKIIDCFNCEEWEWPYDVQFKAKDGHLDVCPFKRSELVRINKRKT
jgi:hypothetical protein